MEFLELDKCVDANRLSDNPQLLCQFCYDAQLVHIPILSSLHLLKNKQKIHALAQYYKNEKPNDRSHS